MSQLPLYLDCTLRDGGYINNWEFSVPFAKALYRAVSRAGVDYLEAGFIEPGAMSGLPWTHLPSELIESLRQDTPDGSKIAALINFGSVKSSNIGPRNTGTPDMLRVACHPKDAAEATRFASELKEKGYTTTVNYMGISNYTNRDILGLVELMNTFGEQVDYFYVADSFGSLLPKRTREIFTTLRFGTSAKLGFHPHNNLQLAFANALEAMEAGIDIIDGSVFGMGRGAGNLYTDAVIAYFEQLEPERFQVEPILRFADLHMANLKEKWDWGYSLPQLLSGLLKCHPNYPTNLLQEKSYTADAIFTMLKALPLEERGTVVGGRIQGLKRNYLSYRANVVQSHRQEDLQKLKEKHQGKVLIVCGGPSVQKESAKINAFISSEKPLVVTVNSSAFDQPFHATFFGNLRRYLQKKDSLPRETTVLLGLEIERSLLGDPDSAVQIKPQLPNSNMAEPEEFWPTNSGIEAALPFLTLGFTQLTYCGLDGFGTKDNYFYEEQDPVVSPAEIEKNNRIVVEEWNSLKKMSQQMNLSLQMLTTPLISLT